MIKVEPWVISSAVRYALGRRSYVVSETAQTVMNVWEALPETTRAVIVRDVKDEIAHPGGMDMDTQTWLDLLAWIEEQA